MATHDDQAVHAALRRVWPDVESIDRAEIRALEGGVDPRSYLVAVGERRCVLRMPARARVALLDLATEVRAMRAAAAAGIAPGVVGVDTVEGILLTEYHAAPRTTSAVRPPPNVVRMAALLRVLHAIAVELPVFAAEQIAAQYLAALTDEVGLGAVERSWAAELIALARHFDASFAPTAFCHNDLAAANVLDTGGALRLVDFEYAVRSAPLLDLAGLAGMNDYNETQRRELLAAYYGDSTSAATAADLDRAVRMVRLLAFFWARTAARRVPGTDVYALLAARLGETLK